MGWALRVPVGLLHGRRYSEGVTTREVVGVLYAAARWVVAWYPAHQQFTIDRVVNPLKCLWWCFLRSLDIIVLPVAIAR